MPPMGYSVSASRYDPDYPAAVIAEDSFAVEIHNLVCTNYTGYGVYLYNSPGSTITDVEAYNDGSGVVVDISDDTVLERILVDGCEGAIVPVAPASMSQAIMLVNYALEIDHSRGVTLDDAVLVNKSSKRQLFCQVEYHLAATKNRKKPRTDRTLYPCRQKLFS